VRLRECLNKDVPATREWGGVSYGVEISEAGRGEEKKKVIVEREAAGRREAQISIHQMGWIHLGMSKGTAVWIRRDEGEGQ
jgi:hypothetical protein